MVIIYTYVCKNVLAVCNNDMKWCIHKHCSLLQLLNLKTSQLDQIRIILSYFSEITSCV